MGIGARAVDTVLRYVPGRRFLFVGEREDYTIQSLWMKKDVSAVVPVTGCVRIMYLRLWRMKEVQELE